MEIYEKIIEVSQGDLDFLDHVNNVRYIQWIQDISEEHWQKKAPAEIKEQVVWVVLNHNVDYRNPARLGDRIRIKTFVLDSAGATSTRVEVAPALSKTKVFMRIRSPNLAGLR